MYTALGTKKKMVAEFWKSVNPSEESNQDLRSCMLELAMMAGCAYVSSLWMSFLYYFIILLRTLRPDPCVLRYISRDF